MEVLRQRVILPSLLWLISILSVVLVGVLGPAMSPVCTIPGVSRVCHLSVRAAPILSPANVSTPMLADFPALMNTVKHFEVLLDQTELLPVVSLNMKTAELSTRDLATTIRYSDLKTSEDLCARLVEFADAARATGPKLDKFSVKVGGVVDDIVAVTNYARRSILAAKSDSVSWWPGKREVSSALELSLQFSAAMALVTKKLDVLIMFAQVLLSELDGMEVKLQLVSDMAEREDTGVQSRAINVRASLWTQLGGHKHALARLDKAKVSIRAVVQYRKDATARVVGALRILNGISNDVEALRGRVSESALVGHMIPVEEQVRSIDEGVQRLLGKKDGVRAARQEASRVTLLEDGQGRWLTVVGEE
ncbi:hypothetical protein FA95DRAFT_1497524 [Auriscalpium vulgare]|uniref:Uncharacterized protein n=1 Tax=Auriscalpium vulgare TaxID=40419 RepID=A0ACB8RJS5_9AGAM|nr:hypothetical protein FA95DRAFT_1497524 [Auriscalpium vulgare]